MRATECVLAVDAFEYRRLAQTLVSTMDILPSDPSQPFMRPSVYTYRLAKPELAQAARRGDYEAVVVGLNHFAKHNELPVTAKAIGPPIGGKQLRRIVLGHSWVYVTPPFRPRKGLALLHLAAASKGKVADRTALGRLRRIVSDQEIK